MKIIIVGLGKVGNTLAVKLCKEENHDITVVDLKQSVIHDLINEHDLMGVVGSGSSIDTLIDAGVDKADILIAVTGSDELNLLTCFIAKKIGNCKTIARVRKPEYNREIHFFKEDLGLEMIINPEQTAASEIAKLLRFPTAIQIDSFAKGRVEILKFKIPDGNVLDNLKIAELGSKLNCDVLICGVQRDDTAFIPSGDFILQSGDLVSIVASMENATHFFKSIGLKTNRVKDTMIVGGGATAVYLAHRLIKSGIKVKIIEQNPARCEELCQLLPKASILNADGTENSVLLEEGLESAESFVSLTNIDEENVLLSLYAQSKTNGKVITKINRIAYDEVISSLNLDTIIFPKDLTAEYIVRFVRAMENSIGCNVETVHYVLDGKAEALEFRIRENSNVTDITLEKLELKKNLIVACINRNGKIIIPRGKDVIKTGDTVIVVTTESGYNDISDILREKI